MATYTIAVGTVALPMLMLLAACGTKRKEPFDGDPAFRMSQPSRLYFANIRASSYYFEKPKGTDLEVYRLRKFSNTAKRPMVIPLIVQAYLKDEAYVFVRPNDFPRLGPGLRIDFTHPDTSGSYVLDAGSKAQQLQLAEDLRTSVLRGDSLSVRLNDGTAAPIYRTREERGHLLTVMLDYDRLRDK